MNNDPHYDCLGYKKYTILRRAINRYNDTEYNLDDLRKIAGSLEMKNMEELVELHKKYFGH